MTQDWDAAATMASLAAEPWEGSAWRIHKAGFDALSTGDRLRSARYHYGEDLCPPERAFAALYLALAPEIAVAELTRHIGDIELAELNDHHLTEIAVHLHAVLDCRNLEYPSRAVLCNDSDPAVPRALGAAAFARGVEGILVPSATGLGDNLVVFVDRVLPQSRLAVVSHREPRLRIENPSDGL